MRVHHLYRPVLLVLMLALTVVLLTACDPTAGHYPWQLGHGWVCDDPDIILDTWRAEDGTIHYGGEKIIQDDNTVELIVEYRGHVAYFYSEKYVRTADLLICGKWKIVNGCLIVEITEDNIFDGKYTKLVFRPLDSK